MLRGTLKRRLAAQGNDASAASASGAASSSEAPAPKRARGSQGRGGGIRTRVGEAARQPGEDDDQGLKPLNRWSVDAWGKGKISSKDVLEIAAAADAQGAVGALQLGSVKHARNAQRALVAALGMPSGAPDFTWLEIPTQRGPTAAHPFLLPHLWFEALHRSMSFGLRA